MPDVEDPEFVVGYGVKDQKWIAPDRHSSDAGFICHLRHFGEADQ
jgi:hypothetical protein